MASYKVRWRIFAAAAIGLCLALAAGKLLQQRYGSSTTSDARRNWRDGAIAKIENLIQNSAWMKAEQAQVPDNESWGDREMLVFNNGDWIVCQNICNKEDRRIRDLFIGRGSDGKWYYSTFHFCVRRMVLNLEPRPESLSEFADAFWLAPFEGKSDESLKETWDSGKPYGLAKIQAERRAQK